MNIAMKAVGFWLFWSNRLLLYLCFVEGCPDGWLNYGSSCYYVKDTLTRKQSDARQHCQNLGGDLAIIKSENQNDFIFNLTRSDWKWTSVMMRKQTCSREPGDKLFRLQEALPLSMFIDCKFDKILSETASTCKRNNFWNCKEKCDSWKVPLSQGMGSSRESYRRRSRDGREG